MSVDEFRTYKAKVNEEEHKRLKFKAIIENRKLGEILGDLIRDYGNSVTPLRKTGKIYELSPVRPEGNYQYVEKTDKEHPEELRVSPEYLELIGYKSPPQILVRKEMIVIED